MGSLDGTEHETDMHNRVRTNMIEHASCAMELAVDSGILLPVAWHVLNFESFAWQFAVGFLPYSSRAVLAIQKSTGNGMTCRIMEDCARLEYGNRDNVWSWPSAICQCVTGNERCALQALQPWISKTWMTGILARIPKTGRSEPSFIWALGLWNIPASRMNDFF